MEEKEQDYRKSWDERIFCKKNGDLNWFGWIFSIVAILTIGYVLISLAPVGIFSDPDCVAGGRVC